MTSDSDFIEPELLEPLEKAVARKKELAIQYSERLQPIHIAFVNQFFQSQMDISVAAGATGISVKKANEWLAEGHPVAEYVARRLETWSADVDVTMEEIIGGLKSEALNITDRKTDTQAARVAAWDKLAKIKGLYDKGQGRKTPAVAVQINIGKIEDE